MLQTAIEAARRAGQLIAERFPAQHHVTSKGYRDIVTEVDTAAEAVILELIGARFPDHAIFSEEAGGSGIGGEHAHDTITWVIDPLDGTINYAHHLPISAVSIGVLEQGKPVVGVVYDPLRDQLFAAERGKGATLDGRPIRASRVKRLDHAVIGFDWGHSDEVRARMLRFLQRVAPRCGTARSLGSAVLAQAYVAAGWMDGYINPIAKPWDTAAGALIVAEANGTYTNVAGEGYRADAEGCVATNGLIHDELLSMVADSLTR